MNPEAAHTADLIAPIAQMHAFSQRIRLNSGGED
jgi:hypothetical protein